MRRRFDWHERKAFLDLLTKAEGEAACGEVWPGTLSDVAAVMRQICAVADLVVEAERIEFTATTDHKRYFLTKVGLWRFGDVQEEVTAHDWWLAALRTWAHFLSLHLDRLAEA